MSAQNNMPLVSVIIPVYNSRKFVGNTIDTILTQSFTDFEIIIVDDGSTDGSSEFLDEYAERDNRIFVHHVKNGGPSKARNIALDNARGEWVQFVDSDDLLEKDMMEQLFKNSRNNELVISGVLDKDLDTGKVKSRKLPYAELSNKQEIGNYLIGMDISSKRICLNYLWNKWFRRSIIDESNLRFDETIRLGEDFIFISKYFKNISRLVIVDGAYYNYCYHGTNSLTGRFDVNELQRRDVMYEAFKELLENYNVLEKGQNILKLTEGMHLIKGLSKIGLPSCKLKKSEKLEYIKMFLNSPYKERMVYYLDSFSGVKNVIRKIVIKNNMSNLIYYMYRKG